MAHNEEPVAKRPCREEILSRCAGLLDVPASVLGSFLGVCDLARMMVVCRYAHVEYKGVFERIYLKSKSPLLFTLHEPEDCRGHWGTMTVSGLSSGPFCVLFVFITVLHCSVVQAVSSVGRLPVQDDVYQGQYALF